MTSTIAHRSRVRALRAAPIAVAAVLVACTRSDTTARPAAGAPSGGASNAPPALTTSMGDVSRSAARESTLAVATSFAPIARIVTPAVVSIESQFSAATAARMQGDEEPQLPPGLLPPGMQPVPQGPVRATGSGFIVSRDGYILTNNHVIADAEKVTVTLNDRRIFPAKIVGRDPNTDVALIKIGQTNLPTVQLGDDSTTQVGDPVLAFGNPLGLDFTVTAGIISAKGRSGSLRSLFPSSYAIADFLQSDAVINPGNSGGPLVDMHGQVVGMNSAIASPTGVYAGYGFAIPVGIVRIIMNQLRADGRVHRAILGVAIQDVGPADAQAAGLTEIRGALVGGYSGNDSPAKRAGINPGDIILSVDGHPVSDVAQTERMLLGYKPGQTVQLVVMRYGSQRTVRLTLGEAPEETTVARAGAPPAERSASRRLGIAVSAVTSGLAAQLQLPDSVRGLVVMRVDPSGAASGRLVPTDVIVAWLDRGAAHPVRSVNDLQEGVSRARSGVLSLLVYSPQVQGTRVVNVPLTSP
ncbi:MAG: trypsin-like peptidase domain-containing protein [Gemmatimonadaceae bacterium]|nr:trypsin-like peptidase domain-containing protein [Gemmatimonadaceae bacterium]